MATLEPTLGCASAGFAPALEPVSRPFVADVEIAEELRSLHLDGGARQSPRALDGNSSWHTSLPLRTRTVSGSISYMHVGQRGKLEVKRQRLVASVSKSTKSGRIELVPTNRGHRPRTADGDVSRKSQLNRVAGHSRGSGFQSKYRNFRIFDVQQANRVSKSSSTTKKTHRQPPNSKNVQQETQRWDGPGAGRTIKGSSESALQSTETNENNQQMTSGLQSGKRKAPKITPIRTAPTAWESTTPERRPLSPLTANQGLERSPARAIPTSSDTSPTSAAPQLQLKNEGQSPSDDMRQLGCVKSIRLRSGSVVTVITPEHNVWQRNTYLPGPIKLDDGPIPKRKDSVANLDAFQAAVEDLEETSKPRRASDDAVIDGIVDYFNGFGAEFGATAAKVGGKVGKADECSPHEPS